MLSSLPFLARAKRTLKMTWIVQVFRIVSSCTATMMILSPSPTIYKIHTSGSTAHASILPLVSMFANCHIWMMYGYLDENMYPIFGTYALGDVIALCYIAVFYRSTSDRASAQKLITVFGAALLVASTYAVLGGLGYTNQTRSKVANVVGYIGITSAVVLYSSPFEKIRQVLQHRSGVFIPIHMVVAAIANNASWVVYSALTNDWIVCVPNVFMLVMSLTQVALYLTFHPSTHPFELPSTETLEKAVTTSPKHTQRDKHTPTHASTYLPIHSP